MGKQEDSLDSFNSAAQVAQAYQIGRAESAAALNLHRNINAESVQELSSLVKLLDESMLTRSVCSFSSLHVAGASVFRLLSTSVSST